HRFLPSFPTRRSSDLDECSVWQRADIRFIRHFLATPAHAFLVDAPVHFLRRQRAVPRLIPVGRSPGGLERAEGIGPATGAGPVPDRKSTRLNSSHVKI